ncbi:hypothetical protein CAPTEDRAFT_196158 [Capitella teleta]|uniref:Uncharacterized protein n=1 Tax=Capitella teleta TaxID=283909 RepID=R7TZU2_CAPTE|nr:hypothetical protein CAPTEDRAFT_196158 [Capitella teleta]|eukprot:ELT99468.1 hypothetical protein CAPTEDRAFT_196158 [Capitella teleta]
MVTPPPSPLPHLGAVSAEYTSETSPIPVDLVGVFSAERSTYMPQGKIYFKTKPDERDLGSFSLISASPRYVLLRQGEEFEMAMVAERQTAQRAHIDRNICDRVARPGTKEQVKEENGEDEDQIGDADSWGDEEEEKKEKRKRKKKRKMGRVKRRCCFMERITNLPSTVRSSCIPHNQESGADQKSSLHVVAEKPGKLRLYIDPNDLNRTIRRPTMAFWYSSIQCSGC